MELSDLTQINVERAKRWHPGFPADDAWSLADWSNAMCGEAGEAANIVKKIRRVDTGHAGALDPSRAILVAELADEIADVFLYLNLLAAKEGISMEAAVIRKFNAVSVREGWPDLVIKDPR